MKLTHINENGDAHMVDVGEKDITRREAQAQAVVTMQPETLRMILSDRTKKAMCSVVHALRASWRRSAQPN